MSDEFRYPDQRTPSVTPSLTLWLLFIVAFALGAWLMLSLAGADTRTDRLAEMGGEVSLTGEVDQSAMGSAQPDGTPAVKRASAGRP